MQLKYGVAELHTGEPTGDPAVEIDREEEAFAGEAYESADVVSTVHSGHHAVQLPVNLPQLEQVHSWLVPELRTRLVKVQQEPSDFRSLLKSVYQ